MNIVKRLSEPSSWAAIAALVAIFSSSAAELIPQIGAWVLSGAGLVAAAIAIFNKDPGSDE